jgi:leucyl aminopeptidase
MTDIASVHVAARERPEADLVAVGCFEGERPQLDGGLADGVRRTAEQLAGRPGWRGKEEQLAQNETAPGGPVVSLHGLGSRKDFSFNRLARWLWRAAEETRAAGLRRLAVVLPEHAETAAAAAGRIARAAALVRYGFDRYQSKKGDDVERVGEVTLVPPAGEEAAFRAALDGAGAVAAAVAFTRDLANSPPNEASPDWMEERARELAASRGMRVTVLDAAQLAERGMGGLLAVGAGSAHPPRLVRLEWGESGPAVALVGKGVTFDTGGISIKPAPDMDDMKYDKCGACVALGAARAAADLRLPVRLRVYLPLAENMLGGRAYRPGDILRCYNGKTVEITNTDAEGRLILADALAWAVEERADALLEYSTLTGACVVALGHQAAGLFTPDDRLADALLAAAAESGERLWRLPLYPEYAEEMKGTHADLKNAAGRWGGASLAAAFLSQFVNGLDSWAHLDIAGVSYQRAEPNGHEPGATGFGVASTIAWLRRLAG